LHRYNPEKAVIDGITLCSTEKGKRYFPSHTRSSQGSC